MKPIMLDTKLGKASSHKQKAKITDAWLHFLWGNWIKAEAGFMSEYSGERHDLQAHHLGGKSNIQLRYLTLENGMSLTSGEHNYKAHGEQGKQLEFQVIVKQLRDSEIYDRLINIKHEPPKKMSKIDIQDFLLKKLAPHISGLIEYYQSIGYADKSTRHADYKKLFELIAK